MLKLNVLLPTALLASVQVAPLSTLTLTTSPIAVGALNVPLIVCAATLVMKSVALAPESLLKETELTVVVGGSCFARENCEFRADLLPAASVAVTTMVLSDVPAPATEVEGMVTDQAPLLTVGV